MCIICVELIKQRMTLLEAEKNIGELLWTTKREDIDDILHLLELNESIINLDTERLDKVLTEGSKDD